MSSLVDAARKYLGVKFRHRGRSPRALDCAGLPWLAYKDLGVDLPDFRLYGPEPHNDGLITHITAALGDPVAVAPVCESDLRAGDIAVIRFEVDRTTSASSPTTRLAASPYCTPTATTGA